MRTVVLKAIGGLVALLALMAFLSFFPARTFDFVEAWILLTIFGASTIGIALYLARADPELLRRRVMIGAFSEREGHQWLIQSVAFTGFILILVLSGRDRRHGWSEMPTALVAAGDGLVIVGFAVVLIAFRHNSFAAATIKVEATQQLVSTGLYGVVRHPLYAGVLLFLIGMPLALGSWVALAGTVISLAAIVWRIGHEERFLASNLAGYDEYRRAVRHRLVPGAW